MTQDYYDELETREPEARRQALYAALPGQISNAQQNAPAFSEILRGIDPAGVSSPGALARLPVTRKSSLIELQKQNPPFGGFTTLDAGRFARVFSSPGPIYEPEAERPDYWRMARTLFAAGFRSGDMIHNSFAYHLTPAGFMLESGARALGCTVVPAGVGQTEMQIETIAHMRPQGYIGTPSFLKIILEKASVMAVDVSSIGKALVSGEALPPSLRAELKVQGVDVLQAYATADLGLIAYESPALEGMIVDEGVIVEIVRPGTGDPVAEGEVGEVVVTTFCPEYPLVRFATGDMSAVMPGVSPCGRTNMRIKGWMGRADQTTKVRGMFVHPEQVAAVLKRHPELTAARLVVDNPEGKDVMTLRCVTGGDAADDTLSQNIADSIREICKVRGEVEFVEGADLPNDGKVIDDTRSYE